jgi:hypothetical protein
MGLSDRLQRDGRILPLAPCAACPLFIQNRQTVRFVQCLGRRPRDNDDRNGSDHLPEALNRVAYGGERAPIERRGEVIAAIVSKRDPELSECLEGRYWAETAQEALDERQAAGEKPIPWEQVKAGLGLSAVAYRVELTPKAARELADSPAAAQQRIAHAIDQLAHNPRCPGHGKLAGAERLYRCAGARARRDRR